MVTLILNKCKEKIIFSIIKILKFIRLKKGGKGFKTFEEFEKLKKKNIVVIKKVLKKKVKNILNHNGIY